MSKRKPKEEHKKSGRRPYLNFTEDKIAIMGDMWKQGVSQTIIAKQFNTCQAVISRVLRSAGFVGCERQLGPKHIGPESGGWKGGRILSGAEKYVAIWVPPDHKFASMRHRMGYIPEHRLVMAESLGRALNRNETVHHINGDSQDNRLENLQLRQCKHGKGVVVKCLDCGSHNISSIPIAEPPEVKTE
jgi:hypothetical protein